MAIVAAWSAQHTGRARRDPCAGGDFITFGDDYVVMRTFLLLLYSQTLLACTSANTGKENPSFVVTNVPDSSPEATELRESNDSTAWDRYLFHDLDLSILMPSSWGNCKLEQRTLLCKIDSSSEAAFQANLVVAVYSGTNLEEYQASKKYDSELNSTWTQIEDNSNGSFWTENFYTAYSTYQPIKGISHPIGMWCFTFEHKQHVVEISLVGLLSENDRLDYIFKFITSRIDTVSGQAGAPDR